MISQIAANIAQDVAQRRHHAWTRCPVCLVAMGGILALALAVTWWMLR